MSRKPPKISVIKLLIALSGNECSFPKCKINLVEDEAFIGELVHISAAETGGPRYDINMSDDERRAFANLMLMCPTHHKIIDKPALVHKYPVETLKKYKKSHEKKMENTQYVVSDAVFDEVVEVISVTQVNILNSGTQTNIQNIYNSAEQFTQAAKSAIEVAEKEHVDSGKDEENDENDDEENGLGLADKIALAEEIMPQWSETIVMLSAEIEKLPPILNSGTEDLKHSDKLNKGMSGRIKVFKKVAGELENPSAKIEELGNIFYSQLQSIDEGVVAMIEMLMNDESDESEEAKEAFGTSIRELVVSAEEAMESLAQLLDSMKPLEAASRDLRKTLKKIRLGLTNMYKGKDIISDWLKLLDTFQNKASTS